MKRPLIRIVVEVLSITALVVFGSYCVHVYRCRTLSGRSDIILLGKMLELNGDMKFMAIQPVEIYKGAVRSRERQRILVDIVPMWQRLDIDPPWPEFTTNGMAVFFLRRSLWSSLYEPLFVETDRQYDLRTLREKATERAQKPRL